MSSHGWDFSRETNLHWWEASARHPWGTLPIPQGGLSGGSGTASTPSPLRVPRPATAHPAQRGLWLQAPGARPGLWGTGEMDVSAPATPVLQSELRVSRRGREGGRPCALGPRGSVTCLSHVLVPECQVLRIGNSGKHSRAWGQGSAPAGAVTHLVSHNGRHSLDGLPYERRGRASATHL